MTGRRKLLIGVAGLLVVVLIAGILAWRQLSANSSSVSLSTALKTYKQAANGGVSGPPRPGVYTYALHGNECASVVGVRLCRTFPSRARVILTRKPGVITIEEDLSQDHLETARYLVRPDGLYLTWQRTRIVFGITQDDAMTTTPATLTLPAALQVGKRWTQRFSAGGLPVVTNNQVTRHTTMTIGGTTVPVYVISASSTTGGDHPGTETDLTWHAPDSGLDVRLVVHRRIGGAFPYTMDVDATLLSLKPLG